MTSAVWKATAAAAAVLALSSCSSMLTDSSASSYLILNSLEAASGAKPDTFGGSLASDVLTYVKKDVGGTQVLVPTVFEDVLQATFSLGLKDPGTSDAPSAPSTTNFITITRYHVDFVRADGRNTPGVDVPYSFDGGATITVGASTATLSATLVRIQAKSEAPLRSLIGGAGAYAISTIAQVTFYGTDQTGRAVSVMGKISVNFADWGDPS